MASEGKLGGARSLSLSGGLGWQGACVGRAGSVGGTKVRHSLQVGSEYRQALFRGLTRRQGDDGQSSG